MRGWPAWTARQGRLLGVHVTTSMRRAMGNGACELSTRKIGLALIELAVHAMQWAIAPSEPTPGRVRNDRYASGITQRCERLAKDGQPGLRAREGCLVFM